MIGSSNLEHRMIDPTWASRLSNLLRELHSIDFGYPLGCNVVRACEGSEVEAVLRSEGLDAIPGLQAFYRICDGVNCPDVHNGYFLKSLTDLVEGVRDREPLTIGGCLEGSIAVVGSTGGGGRFAIYCPNGSVLLLGCGLVQDRVFHAVPESVKVMAPSFGEFLERLLLDVEAFVVDTPGYHYMA